MRFEALAGWFVAVFCVVALPAANAVSVENVRLSQTPERTRLVLDLSGPVQHELSTMREPHRVVIDLRDTSLGPVRVPAGAGLVEQIRTGSSDNNVLRVVLDVTGPVKPRSFPLPPGNERGHRVVVDLEPPAAANVVPRRVKHAVERDIVVAISPGHGGRDPGAIGARGTREKDVVLAIARRLKHHLDAQEGIRGVLIRNNDILVPYRQRMAIARNHRADLFVAIHADAFTNRQAHGSTVYILSERGASSEAARWLANKHNATESELIGGVSLVDKEDDLASVLLDLSQSASLGASMVAGNHVIEELSKIGRVRKKTVQQANFLVLKSPDIPSMLIETAFISNPKDESRLRSTREQDRWGSAIAAGIVNYFSNNPPPDTLFAARHDQARLEPIEYEVTRGDTLSGIADRFNVPLSTLRRANKLRSDVIRIGQVILIPNNNTRATASAGDFATNQGR